MNNRKNNNTNNINSNRVGISDELLTQLALELRGKVPLTDRQIDENERVRNGYYDDYKGSLLKEWESEDSRERRKVLKPTTIRGIEEVLYHWKDNHFTTVAEEWNRPLNEYPSYQLRWYFTDKYLKEVELYEEAIEGECKVAMLKKKAKKNKTTLFIEIDRANLREYFEESFTERSKILKPNIYKELIDFIYNDGEFNGIDRCIGSLSDLKEMGILDEIITSEALEAIEASDAYKAL
jgi:hypothetical protein